MISPGAPAFPAPLRDALASEVRRAFGLVFPASRQQNLESGLSQAAALLCEQDTAALLERLKRDDPEALDALASQLTIGETYFFRHTPHFEFLRELFRQPLDKAEARPRSLWSAGCSSGEEAYSMAIVALETLGLSAGAEVEILATDINQEALARAQEGIYTEWSFRGVSPDRRARWFEPEGSRFRVIPEVKAMVRFAQLNLLPDGATTLRARAEEPWPRAVDIVFCRNVLLYLAPASLAVIGEAIARSLAPGGRLIPGPADPTFSIKGLRRIGKEGLLFYQRTVEAPQPVEALQHPCEGEAAEQAPPSAKPPCVPPPASRGVPLAPLPAPLAPSPPSPAAPPDVPQKLIDSKLAQARLLVDRGDASAALEALNPILASDPLRHDAYLLRAIALQVLSDHTRAALDAERAILLNPTSAMAHMLAAVSKGWLGDDAGARRSARNAERLLASLSPEATVPDAGGARGGELLATVREISRALVSPRRSARPRSKR